MTRIQLRRGTSQQWKDADPVLAAGEPGWDLETSTLKVGDGSRRWSDLSPVHLGDVRDLVQTAVGRAGAGVGLGRHRQAWDAAAARSAVQPVRILFLGSSTTYGNNASTPSARFVNQVVLRAQAQFPAPGGDEASVRSLSDTASTPNSAAGIQGINGSAGGVTSAAYCSPLILPFVQRLSVAFAVHMVGSNDSVNDTVPVDAYRANVRAAAEGLAARGVTGQLLVHTYRRQGVSKARWAEYGTALADVAARVPGTSVLDVSEVFESLHHLTTDPLRLIDSDTVHMTDAGHALMGEQVAAALGIRARPRAEARPAAHTVPVGAVHMDADSGRPLFSTGAAWVHANGDPA